jgi:hypothetical protein
VCTTFTEVAVISVAAIEFLNIQCNRKIAVTNKENQTYSDTVEEIYPINSDAKTTYAVGMNEYEIIFLFTTINKTEVERINRAMKPCLAMFKHLCG